MTFSDLGDIAIAWRRAANPTPEQQALADERLAVCDTCEFKQRGFVFDYKCGACGCPLHKKIFSSTIGSHACPKHKWAR